MTSELPLAEILFDFYDRLKTITQGYGSFDYDIIDYRETDLVKVDILVNGEKVDALSQLVHREKARQRALHYCERLAETIPRQNFKIAIQGAIGGNIIARSTINAYRKDVTAKCYGGDITPQAQAAGEAEGRQEADEDGGLRRDPPGGLPGGAQGGAGRVAERCPGFAPRSRLAASEASGARRRRAGANQDDDEGRPSWNAPPAHPVF